MEIASKTIVFLIALLHLYIMIIEMWFWDKPKGLKMFRLKQDFATNTKTLAANQGLYNGFLAAGLLWGIVQKQYLFGLQIQLFFLFCVFVAGLYGAFTTSKKILFVQSVPSTIAIILVAINYFNL